MRFKRFCSLGVAAAIGYERPGGSCCRKGDDHGTFL